MSEDAPSIEDLISSAPAKAAPVKPKIQTTKPVPEKEANLTPEQIQIRELEDQLAAAKAANLELPVVKNTEEYAPPVGQLIKPTAAELAAPETKIIHVVAEALTAMGTTFYKGQEIVVTQAVRESQTDKEGKCWFDLDDDAQWDRFGEIMFRNGPWKGLRPQEFAKLEASRAGGVPRL